MDGQTITGIANGTEDFYYNIESAFHEKEIKEVQLPETVETIGDYAFYDNDIQEIDIPDGVIYIGLDAFTLNSDFSGLVLPTPQAGNFENWIDNKGNTYSGGEKVTNFSYKSYTADFATGISEVGEHQDNVSIFVDQKNSVIGIESEIPVKTNIFNLSGQIIHSEENRGEHHSIDISDFANGVYVVACTDQSGNRVNKKIIKK